MVFQLFSTVRSVLARMGKSQRGLKKSPHVSMRSELMEQLEDRRMFSSVPVSSFPVSEISPVVAVSNSVNENTSSLSTVVTPAPTITVTGNNGGDPTSPTPVITELGASAGPTPGVQPHTVFVNALDSILGAGTVLTARYQWDFGDPGSAFNGLIGWNAAHTYNNAGTFTITLILTNQLGKSRVLTTNVTIGQANYRSIYVDSVAGSDRNNGATPAAAVQTVAKAMTLVGNNTEILFKSGETFPVFESMALPYQNILVGSYAIGPEPMLMREPGIGTSIISLLNNSANVMVENLTFDSPWASTSLTAPKIPADGIFPGGVNTTIRNCMFLNLDDAINESRNPQGTLVTSCFDPLQTGLRGCFIWGQGTDQVYLGNLVANSTQEHNIRTVWTIRQLIFDNNLTNLNRPVAGTNLSTSKGTIDIHRGLYAYVSDNWCYDGELRVGPRAGPSVVSGDTTQWCVIEGNHTFNHELQVYPGAYHVMIRNNVFSNNTDCISIVPRSPFGDNIQDLTFTNNTGITSGVAGQFINITAGGAAGQISLIDNLWLAPDIIPGQHGTAAIYILDGSDRVLGSCIDNVWPMPSTFNSYAAGGINYVWWNWAPPHGYFTPAAWDSQSFVIGDRFSQTAVAPDGTPLPGTVAATAGLAAPGVFVDINGKPRPIAKGQIAAGALQT